MILSYYIYILASLGSYYIVNLLWPLESVIKTNFTCLVLWVSGFYVTYMWNISYNNIILASLIWYIFFTSLRSAPIIPSISCRDSIYGPYMTFSVFLLKLARDAVEGPYMDPQTWVILDPFKYINTDPNPKIYDVIILKIF